MISNVHYIELFINKQPIELESQDSLGLRINNVLFNPTKTTTTQAEYSYSFDIPSTPHNDKVLNYANNLSRTSKFHARYPAQVYADGHLIFDGSLTIQKYDAKDKMYSCNLVNIKINTLEEIFGDTKMTDLKWMIDFDGAPTINNVNSDYNTKYFFPLACYGMGQFQKRYVTKDDVGATYTPKHTLDKYNAWWISSFFPSLNVVETMKKAFESKGYSVGGSVFNDPNIKYIYASCNLADEQVPIYNIGNPKFGQISATTTWNNYRSMQSQSGSFGRAGTTRVSDTGGLEQDLTFPYEYIKPASNASNSDAEAEYNFSTIETWNMFDTTNNSAVTVNIGEASYLYDPNEMVFVIPANGWYRIHMQINMKLSGEGTSFSATQWTNTFHADDEFKEEKVEMHRHLAYPQTPLEVQLVRNVKDNIELIKGKYNVTYATGRPLQSEYTYHGGSYTSGTYPNKTVWTTDCPHQDPFGSTSPTKTSEMINQATAARNGALEQYGTGNEYSSGGYSSGGRTYGGTRGGTIDTSGGSRASGDTSHVGRYRGRRGANYNTYGFMHKDTEVMPYDQAVSTAFICGFSSMGGNYEDFEGGTVAVMRDGYSWSKMSAVQNGVFCNVAGLDLVNKTSDGGTETIATNYCKNTYKNCPGTNHCTVYNDLMYGTISCCVYLEKNDKLQVLAIQRAFPEGQMYATSGNCTLEIRAVSERSKAALKADDTWGYYSPVEFPTQLNLFNFTNKETKVSDWIKNIQTAFNLEITQDGNSVDINANQGIKKNINYSVDIDDRVNSSEAESQYISYPREMSVKYKIDTEEYGFELTIPPEHIDDEGDEWKKWGDSGYTVIQLSDDTYETSTQNTQTQFSYTWYDHFLWKDVQEDGTETSFSGLTITIPIIEKAEYMAEDYGYEDAMEHDGYSLTQRFWYRDQVSQEYVWTSDVMHEKIYLTYPMNSWERFNLSYKDTEKSIVSEYFNVSPMLSSNYVKVDTYITPKEYSEIKGGALVHFDSDLYYTGEISGYDPSGNNPTTLKLIKKV